MKKGEKMSEELKEKIRQGNLGKKRSEETKQKISLASKGRVRSDDTKEKIRFGNLGKIQSREAKKKLSISRKGIIFTDEHLRNLSKSHEGQKAWNKGLTKETDERVMKISNSERGKKVSEEVTKRISAVQQGIPFEKWEKFISRDPYSRNWNNQFKNLIRKRDNQVCMNCNKHREKLIRALCVHHINYNKQLSIKENCVSLCLTCHLLTNTNRDYWIKLFQEKLSKLYNYKYDEKGNVIINLLEEKDEPR